MTRTSWLKKIWTGTSRGVSTVVGTVFLMLIIFMVSTNVLLWTFQQNAEYNQALMERNQEEADRSKENVIASDGRYSVDGDQVTVEAELRNAGSVAAQIVNLWVFDTTIKKYSFSDTIESLNLNLNPGDNRTVSAVVTIPGAGQSHTFNSWFVTARGNTVPLEEEQEITFAQLAQGVGYLAMDYDSFTYFLYDDDDELENYPTGISSFDLPYATDVAFGIILTNLDPLKRTITLDLHSQIWLDFPAAPGAGPFVWYIVNEANGVITTPYSDITLEYQETKLLVFASGQAGGFSKVNIGQPQAKNKLCAVNLLLHGTIGDKDYGQKIPFVSLFCYET